MNQNCALRKKICPPRNQNVNSRRIGNGFIVSTVEI